jgi:hypothetical protein
MGTVTITAAAVAAAATTTTTTTTLYLWDYKSLQKESKYFVRSARIFFLFLMTFVCLHV